MVAARESLYQPDYTPATASAYFHSLAAWTAGNWFSDDTVFGAKWDSTLATIPSPAMVYPPLSSSSNQVLSQGAAAFPGSANSVLAMARRAWLFSPYPISPALEWLPEPQRYDLRDDELLRENAACLVNKAIVQSEALLDHFFRGRLRLAIERTDSQQFGFGAVVMKNDSVLPMVGGVFRLSYEAVDGSDVPIDGSFTTTLAPGQEIAVTSCQALSGADLASLPPSVRIGSRRRLTVVYRGVIGVEEGVIAASIGVPDYHMIHVSNGVGGTFGCGSGPTGNGGFMLNVGCTEQAPPFASCSSLAQSAETVLSWVSAYFNRDITFTNPGGTTFCYESGYGNITYDYSVVFNRSGAVVPLGSGALLGSVLYGDGVGSARAITPSLEIVTSFEVTLSNCQQLPPPEWVGHAEFVVGAYYYILDYLPED